MDYYYTPGNYQGGHPPNKPHYKLTFAVLCFSILYLATCLASILYLGVFGPALVPSQDTRITSIVISTGSKLAGALITFAIARSSWAEILGPLLEGRHFRLNSLVGACRDFGSLGQLLNYRSLPAPLKIHLWIVVSVTTAMIATSSSFRYESRPVEALQTALLADVAYACPTDLGPRPELKDKFFCNPPLDTREDINANTSLHAWSYITPVYSGGQGTVTLSGEIDDLVDDHDVLGANVTLAILPDGWSAADTNRGGGGQNNLPWMAMSVHCTEGTVEISQSGTGMNANTTVYLDGLPLEMVDIVSMPAWDSIVLLFPRVNETGPFSSLSLFHVVMLARDGGDGVGLPGVAVDAVTDLGAGWVSLRGYGPVRQRLLGAATTCTMQGSTGGRWQEGLWPPLNHTKNTVWGELVDDRPTLATALLNYGPSWQYTIVSDNYLPGGSVAYIANHTGVPTTFSRLFMGYVRNQWALMAYAIPRHCGRQIEQEFVGIGPERLFISLTLVAIAPGGALVVGLIVAAKALIATVGRRYWVSRIEFESWWLVKALRGDLYPAGHSNATEDEFGKVCSDTRVAYCDTRPQDEVGNLALWRVAPTDMAERPVIPKRHYA